MLVVPGDHFGMDGYLRLGFGEPPDYNRAGLDRLRDLLSTIPLPRKVRLLDRMTRPELTLVLIGFGNVARRFVRLLGEIADRLDFTWQVVAIATRHHGTRDRSGWAWIPGARSPPSNNSQSLDRPRSVTARAQRHRRDPPGRRCLRRRSR